MKTARILILLTALFAYSGCAENSSNAPSYNNEFSVDDELVQLTASIADMPVGTIDQSTIDGLTHMREEEKLARDVYQHLSDTYGTVIFSNIARSEARHMDAIKTLLDRYGIADPVVSDARGVFGDQHFTDLYTQLTVAGDANLNAALTAGATIEDLDIKDLMDRSIGMTAQDILLVYGNLTRASQNHLRAFAGQLTANGASYIPQFISQTLYDSILAGQQGNGRGRGRRG